MTIIIIIADNTPVMMMIMKVAAPGVSDDEGAEDGADSSAGSGHADSGGAWGKQISREYKCYRKLFKKSKSDKS